MTRSGAVALLSVLAAQAVSGQATRLVEDLRIDGGQHEFTSVTGVLPLSNGNVFLVHPGDFAASLYSATGAELKKFARKGAGPGEVQDLGNFGLVADTLWLSDRSQNRLTFFAPDGSLIRSVVISESANWDQLRPGSAGSYNSRVLPRAVLPGDVSVGSPGTIVDALLAGKVKSIPLVRTSWNGAVVKIVGDQPVRIVPPLEVNTAAGTRRAAQPFRVSPMLEVSRNGRHFAVIDFGGRSESAIHIERFDDQGRSTGTFDVPYTPIAMPARVIDSAVTAIAKAMRIPENEAAVRFALDAPKSYPPVDLALVAHDGAVWLRAPVRDGQREWTVVSPTGKVVERLVVPATTALRWIDGSIWAVSRDADDVPSVVRLRRR